MREIILIAVVLVILGYLGILVWIYRMSKHRKVSGVLVVLAAILFTPVTGFAIVAASPLKNKK